MQVFDSVYKKNNVLQCKFKNNFIHAAYIGAEFPIGQHLVTAITYSKDYALKLFNNLVSSYISCLDSHNDTDFSLYEKALFEIDDYCIYFHEIAYRLITAIDVSHPNYSLCDLMDFIKSLDNKATAFTYQFPNVKKDGMVQMKECLSLWNIAAGLMLDEFELTVSKLKDDVYDVCNASPELSGLSKLSSLDNKRVIDYCDMEFRTSLNSDLGEAKNSKFFISGLSAHENISVVVSIESTLDMIYYDFISMLEQDLPIKICKNCHKPFIPKGRADSLYCDRIMPGFRDKCSAIGAINTYKSNLSDIESEFYAARRRYNTRVSRNPLLKTEFEVWKIKAKEKLTAYRNSEISADEFKKWFMDDKWTRI